MLRNSIIVLFILNILIDNLFYLSLLLILGIGLNLFLNKNLWEQVKKLKFLIFLYITTFLIQIYYNQEGEVFFKVFNIYVTKGGVVSFASNFLRIINLIVLSWLINTKKILPKRLKVYQDIIEEVIRLVPQVIKIFKERRKIKWFFRYILRQIKIKN